MIVELGHFALVMGLCATLVQGLVPLLGAAFGRLQWMALAAPAAWLQLACLVVAYAALTNAFVEGDFSVAYVAQHSNSALPFFYRITAVWGSHEGSMLLWCLVMAGWTAAVAAGSTSLPSILRARVLGTLGLISVGLLAFVLATSNPFERLWPAVAEGNDLNPLLQDPGMILHPPMLYMGYVGLAVPFAFAVASLMGGRVDATWTRWTRPWTTVAWIFLTIGIALGSWWAYYELGWGGWWFWDPVENASFMPWLIATALLHSLAVTEQRGAFRAWTLLLALSGFSLSLLGTFLVRSGVLVSVHAFATDPTRGGFILVFLALVIGSALVLYAWRAPRLANGGRFELVSRETFLLVNNVALVVACATVLLGTLYPLIVDGLGMGKISVGPPYFDAVFLPLMLPVVLFIGVAPSTRWKQDNLRRLAAELWPVALVSALVGLAVMTVSTRMGILSAVAMCFTVWVIGSTGYALFRRMRTGQGRWRAPWQLGRSFLGMSVAHLGVAVFVAGVCAVNTLSEETDALLRPGESISVGGYRLEFRGVRDVRGPNYRAQVGTVDVYDAAGHRSAALEPEKRFYLRQEQPMTEAAIDAGLSRDLYVALGEARGDDAWSVRAQYKAWVRLIWLGAILMALGGVIAVTDRRYRLVPKPEAVESSSAPGPTDPAATGHTA